jgi:arginine repressor
MTETLVRAQSRQLVTAMLDRFTGDAALKAVFLNVDGNRSQNEILDALRSARVQGASAATVSRKLDVLAHELHLIELRDRTAKGKIYARTNLDRILGISRALER